MRLCMLRLQIITPEQNVFDGDCVSVTLPSGDGEITVLQHHVPIVTTLHPGSVVVRRAGNDERVFAVSRGMVEMDGTTLRILADIADPEDTLDEATIEKAKADAEKLKTSNRHDAEAFADATAILDRELARLKTVRRRRSPRPPMPPTSNV